MYIVVSFDCCVFRTYSILQACFALVQGSHTKSPLHLSYILLDGNTQVFPETKCTSLSCTAMWTETHRPFLKQSVLHRVVVPWERKHTGLSWNKVYLTELYCHVNGNTQAFPETKCTSPNFCAFHLSIPSCFRYWCTMLYLSTVVFFEHIQ